MEGHVLMPLAPGFEEIEAVTIVDVLRRAEMKVVIAGVERRGGAGERVVRGAHGLDVGIDAHLDELDAEDAGMLVLPGGMPGAARLMECERVLDLARELVSNGRFVAAICAAPMVLGAAGVLKGLRATCYPGFEARLLGAEVVAERVVVDGRVITSRGPGTAIEFALALVEAAEGAEKASELRSAMLV